MSCILKSLWFNQYNTFFFTEYFKSISICLMFLNCNSVGVLLQLRERIHKIELLWPPFCFESDRVWCYWPLNVWAATWQNQQNGCAPSEDSDQSGLIRVFAVCMKKDWVLSYPLSAPRRLWSDWADAHADLSLRSALTHFVAFVISRLILV